MVRGMNRGVKRGASGRPSLIQAQASTGLWHNSASARGFQLDDNPPMSQLRLQSGCHSTSGLQSASHVSELSGEPIKKPESYTNWRTDWIRAGYLPGLEQQSDQRHLSAR